MCEVEELDDLLAFYSQIWGAPSATEWKEWSEKLSGCKYRFAREAFSNLWASQSKRQRPLYSSFLRAYREVVIGWDISRGREPLQLVSAKKAEQKKLGWSEFIDEMNGGKVGDFRTVGGRDSFERHLKKRAKR